MAASAAATSLPTAISARRLRARGAVRAWIWLLVVLVVAMVAIGGATRLTGSGLSITEWKPVTGAVPPLSTGAWEAEFEKYRGSSQYRNLNRGMSLDEFKTIYWWEWSHRQLGRSIGIVFFLPLLGFWTAGAISRRFALAMLGVGALGGLQATVGWIMVASGLQPGMTAVAPLKLMLHLVIASLILAILAWIAWGLGGGHARPAEPSLSPGGAWDGDDARRWPAGRPLALVLLALVLVQIALGGLVAGSRAGLTYNTWPLMDGRLVPEFASLFAVMPAVANLVDNPLLVQFNHRVVAYLLVAAALWQAWSWRQRAPGSRPAGSAALVAAVSLAQAALGVVTLLLAVPLWAGLAHQLLAMGLLMAATAHARRLAPARDPSRAP